MKNIRCRKCKNLRNNWCEKVIDSPDPDVVRDCQHFAMMTNADRIRAMTDEELARWAWGVQVMIVCEHIGTTVDWLDWLKKEANDGN